MTATAVTATTNDKLLNCTTTINDSLLQCIKTPDLQQHSKEVNIAVRLQPMNAGNAAFSHASLINVL